LLQKLPIAKAMFAAQVLYGFVLVGTGFANNFATLIVLRVLLGALEAPIVPGNFLILSMWYLRTHVLQFRLSTGEQLAH
jgi:ACS family allantoate permease-like MFS transporter